MKRGKYINFNTHQRLRTVAKLYAYMLLVNNIDYNLLYVTSYNSDRQKCIIPIPDRAMLRHRTKMILNNERLQQMTAEILLTKMEASGMTVEKAIKKRAEILDLAIAKGQLGIANKTLDSIDNKLGIGDEQLIVLKQPLLEAHNTPAISFQHLTAIKEVNYTAIKTERDDKLQPS